MGVKSGLKQAGERLFGAAQTPLKWAIYPLISSCRVSPEFALGDAPSTP
jgi:hypothetical protein